MIPKDWTVVPFQKLLEFRNGINADRHAYGKGVAFINVFEIISKGHLKVQDIPGRVSIDKKSIESYIVRRGDIVFNRSSETQDEVGLSSVYLDDAPAVFGGFVIRGQCKQALDPIYSGYAFRAPAIRTQIVARGQGAIRANIGQSDLKQVHAPLPPLDEQRAIAEALSDSDTLIESLDQLIAKKRQIKQGVMQELLTGKHRLPGFSGTWNEVTIKKAIQIPVTDGPHMTPVFLEDGVPFLSVNNLIDGKIDFSDLRYISVLDHEEFSKKCKPQKEDILLGKAASVGKVALVETNTEFNIWSPLALIRVNSKNHAKFVYYQLQSNNLNRQISLLTNSSSQGNIGMGDIEKLVLPLPDKDEQLAIATILSDMDTELAALEVRLAKAHQIKQGMMQELLTGRIRLL